MEAWGTFAVIVGGAAGALIGLLFVAVSIRVEAIAASGEVRNRAAQTLGLFLIVLFVAALLAVPEQSYRTLGIELLVLAVLTASTLYILDRRATADRTPQSVGRMRDAVAPNAVTSVLLLSASLVLVLSGRAGLYMLIAPAVGEQAVSGAEDERMDAEQVLVDEAERAQRSDQCAAGARAGRCARDLRSGERSVVVGFEACAAGGVRCAVRARGVVRRLPSRSRCGVGRGRRAGRG